MPSCYTEIGNNVYLNEDEDSELMKIIEFSVDNGSDNEIKTIIDDEPNTSYMNECLLFNTSSEIIECKLNSSDNNKRVKLPGVVSNKEFIQNILSGYNNDDNNEFNPNKSNVTFNNNPNSDSRNNNLFCEERYEYSENTNESHFVESIVLLDDNLDFNFNKENNRKQVNNIPSFSTGTGKKVVINDESMKKAGKLVFGEELTFGDDNGDNDSILKDQIFPSFSTGTGKKVVINDESMKKAGKLVFGEELTFGDDNDDNDSILKDQIFPSFSTGTGKKVVIDDESMKKAGKLVFGEELTFGDDNGDNDSILKDQIFPSFSTGTGKKVVIDDESMKKAGKLVFGEELTFGDDNGDNDSILKDQIFPSFSTGTGKKVVIDDESMKKAGKLVFGEELTFGDDNGDNDSILKDQIFPSFSTGTGKKVVIDDESMKKAGKLVFGEELTFGDDNITKINNSQKIVTKIHNIHKNIKNNLGRTNTSSTINNNENKIIHESPKKRKIIKREELIVPNLFQEYSEVAYNDIINIDRNGNSNKIISPTYILIDQSIETLKKYIFVLKKGINDYIIIDYDRIYLEIESFLSKYPIFPKGMHKYRLRWFQIQYLLVLYDECLIWIRKIKNKIKNTGNTTEILENVGCPSIKRILSRICRRAIYEFFDAKRSPLVKICEGDFTISVPLNLRILAHSDKEFVDEMGEQQKRKIITCTDGWYIIKIHTVFPEMKNLENIPRNIFVCGGNWLSPNTELGHPLEIESATLDYPNLLYGFNMIRPVLNLKNFKLGFHFNPLLFRLKNLVTTSTLVVGRNGNGHSIKESKINNSIDCGGGLVFLVQIVVIHVFPMCYRELVDDANNNGCDEDNENRDGIYHYITRDEDEMNITLNIEMQEMEEKSFKIRRSSQKSNFGNLSGNDVINDSQEGDCSQGSDSSIYNNNDSNSTRRISIDSRMLVLDYWKYLELLKRSNYEASILDLIENCSILTLPSGIDIDDLATIKPGTVIRLSWMKIFRNNKKLNGDNGYSYSRLIPTKKTSLSLKKKVVGCQVFDKIINLIEKPVLVSNSESIDHISILKGGWPLNIVGLLLYIYPIEERKRGYEHCFEFKILLISPIGYKIFIRVHTTAFNDSELRMCKRVNIKLSNAISLCSSNDYRRHILFVENADFNYYERSTGLFYFNAKIPYSVFNIPYSPGTDYFSTLETQRSLSKTINDLSFYTNCRLPALFE